MNMYSFSIIKIKSAIKAAIILSLSFIFLYLPNAQAEIELVIDKSGTDVQVKIVVLPFVGYQGSNISSIIEADFKRSGRFKLVNFRSAPGITPMGTRVDPNLVKRVRADYILRGRRMNNDRRSGLEFELLNTATGQSDSIFRLPYHERYRRMAHKSADMVYNRLTGIRGAFDTFISYVGVKRQGRKSTYELVVADSDGYGPQVIVRSPEPIMSISWSPNNSHLAYVSFESGRPAIYVQDLDTGSRRVVSRRKGINGAPTWSPDGRRLAFSLSVAGNPEIYTMDINSGQLLRITQSRAIDTEPSWERNGSSIVFTSDRGGSPQLYRIPSRGGRAQRITFTGNYNSDASVVGGKAALVRREEGRFRIAVMDLSSHEADIVSKGALDEAPSIAPNGSMVIYETRNRGKRGVLAIVSDNGLASTVIHSPYNDSRHPTWSSFVR